MWVSGGHLDRRSYWRLRKRIALTPRLAGIHDVFHVLALRRYVFDPSHVIDFTPLEIGEDLRYEERPLRILARATKELRNRVIPYVKVQWSNHEEREATWEPETLWRLVGSSVECRDKSESRWRQIDAKRTPCDARAAFSEEICKIAVFLLAVPIQPSRCTGTLHRAARGLLSGWLLYRYRDPCTDLIVSKEESSVGDFVADVAPRSRLGIWLLPEHCEEAGRACDFAVLDVAPVLVAVEVSVPLQLLLLFSKHHQFELKATGFGCCAFRGSGSRQGRRELEPYLPSRAGGTLLQREKKKKEEKKKRSLLEGAWSSTPFSSFHPCKAWSLLVGLGSGPIFNPRRFGACLEASKEAFEAKLIGLEPSFGLDWKDSSLLLELERVFLHPRVFRDSWTTPFGESRDYATVRWV
uniref:Chromo domain-containing protein n=1 Tax=Ananas comosus var. bracteatus TaxID=296719 RepID=A0A6V7PIA9_ANACO|nr:unnamed protein product [Ananas comosus var. bracteatus]